MDDMDVIDAYTCGTMESEIFQRTDRALSLRKHNTPTKTSTKINSIKEAFQSGILLDKYVIHWMFLTL